MNVFHGALFAIEQAEEGRNANNEDEPSNKTPKINDSGKEEISTEDSLGAILLKRMSTKHRTGKEGLNANGNGIIVADSDHSSSDSNKGQPSCINKQKPVLSNSHV
uniref:Uncharacterized protein n=1 Tax=Aplanochytrium stocchinoi TaxID=215587 RepID=A0A6S8DM79_9STRA|mmetsp:Transcript_2579/g.3486  ORF Transcript_2579/g.3486 Transcript_2579/m.3486 type:complete len:106 (-) Transcript_2579:205-522(-)